MMSGNDSDHTVVNYHFHKSGEIPRRKPCCLPHLVLESPVPSHRVLAVGAFPGHSYLGSICFSVKADFLIP